MPKAAPAPSQPSDRAPTRQTRARRLQPSSAKIQEEEECFDLDDVPDVPGVDDDDDDDDYGGDDGDDDRRPTPRSRGARDTAPTAQEINDPDILSTKSNEAKDIKYFFIKTETAQICLECLRLNEADPNRKQVNYKYSMKTSTSSLRPHIEANHLELYKKLAKERGWEILLPGLVSQARSAAAATATVSRQREKFNVDAFYRLLVNFIVADDQSLNVVECPEFRQLLLLLREDLEDVIPHRTKTQELIIRGWKEYIGDLRGHLANSVGRISFTTDIWSDQCRRPYLALTAHWIARAGETSSLQLKAALIAFHRIRGGHDGVSLAAIIIELLDRARITLKVGHFTLDNASNNGTMMEELQRLLEIRDINHFDAKDSRIMCFAHVVDLCSSRVVSGVGNLARDPVDIARSAVNVIRASSTRRDAFDDIVQTGNEKGWWGKQGEPPADVILPKLELLRNMPTRWDSVFLMLNRLREMRPAVDHFFALPNNSAVASCRILPEDWAVMQDLEIVLAVAHRAQHSMSAESTPILSGTVPAFEAFMTKWERLSKQDRLEHLVEPGLEWAYRYYSRMDRTRAYTVAMLLNPIIRMSWVHKHWEQKYITIAQTQIRETMEEYRKKIGTASTQMPVDARSSAGEVPAYMSLAAQYGLDDDMTIGASGGAQEQSIDQEYQAYITAPLSPEGTDILKFWEINGTSYPTLFAMSMDYLPIQASSVPSERVFSSSAETDTRRRNRIHPLLMEALQMLKFHLKKERLNFTAGWVTVEKQLKEDEPEGDLLRTVLDENLRDGLDRVLLLVSKED